MYLFCSIKEKWVWQVYDRDTKEVHAEGVGKDAEHAFQCAVKARNLLVNGKLP